MVFALDDLVVDRRQAEPSTAAGNGLAATVSHLARSRVSLIDIGCPALPRRPPISCRVVNLPLTRYPG